MSELHEQMILRLLVALAVGSAIGLERTFHGRPAGFRTHALVCLSTALLMFLTAFEPPWLRVLAADEGMRFVLDPTRMAQGIMTGIGFLGAGAILKDGLSVRGLTTAASIWMTAAIGILIGIGFLTPALVCAGLTLAMLSVFGTLESHLPARIHVTCRLRFEAARAPDEKALRELLHGYGFSLSKLGYELDRPRSCMQYQAAARTLRRANLSRLAAHLRELPELVEFEIVPVGD